MNKNIKSENKRDMLERLSLEIKSCQKCGLCKTATQAVPGDGYYDADIMFIGEAPGFYEDQKGIPFVGRAGKLLDFLLHQINLERKDIYITNIVKHRPPDNRDPTEVEILACQPFLKRQIEIIQPKVIATLGRYAMNYFLPNAKISTSHGVEVIMPNFVLYPLYHPAAALRNGTVKKALILDFLRLPEIVDKVKNGEISLGNNRNIDPNYNFSMKDTNDKSKAESKEHDSNNDINKKNVDTDQIRLI